MDLMTESKINWMIGFLTGLQDARASDKNLSEALQKTIDMLKEIVERSVLGMSEDIKFVASNNLKNSLYLTQDNQLVKITDGEIESVGPNPFISKMLPFFFLKYEIMRKME